MPQFFQTKINFYNYFDKNYRFREVYLIAGLSVELATQECSIYKAIRNMCCIKEIDRSKRPDINMVLVSTPDISKILISIPEQKNTPSFISGDFMISKYVKDSSNIICARYVERNAELAPMVGIYNGRQILTFIAGSRLAKSYRNSIRMLLLYFLQQRGLFALHAAYLTRNGINILFPGNSGCGKTTIATNLIRNGFICRSDDISFLSYSNSSVMVYPFPARRLHGNHKVKKKPIIEEKKSRYYCYKTASTPNVIIFPSISPINKSRIMPLSANEAMVRIIGSLIFLSGVDRDVYLKEAMLLKDLVNQCHSYLLLSGRDIKKSPDRLRFILQDLIGKQT